MSTIDHEHETNTSADYQLAQLAEVQNENNIPNHTRRNIFLASGITVAVLGAGFGGYELANNGHDQATASPLVPKPKGSVAPQPGVSQTETSLPVTPTTLPTSLAETSASPEQGIVPHTPAAVFEATVNTLTVQDLEVKYPQIKDYLVQAGLSLQRVNATDIPLELQRIKHTYADPTTRAFLVAHPGDDPDQYRAVFTAQDIQTASPDQAGKFVVSFTDTALRWAKFMDPDYKNNLPLVDMAYLSDATIRNNKDAIKTGGQQGHALVATSDIIDVKTLPGGEVLVSTVTQYRPDDSGRAAVEFRSTAILPADNAGIPNTPAGGDIGVAFFQVNLDVINFPK